MSGARDVCDDKSCYSVNGRGRGETWRRKLDGQYLFTCYRETCFSTLWCISRICILQIVSMNMYEISKKNFLTDKRSILFYTASMPDRYRSADVSRRICTRTEFIRTKNISFVKGERDNFYRGGRKVILTRWCASLK